jgi:hypothetical protein
MQHTSSLLFLLFFSLTLDDDFPVRVQLKDFILGQAEAYEFKIGDQVFRRPGDPPLEEVIEMLRKEKMNKSEEDEL